MASSTIFHRQMYGVIFLWVFLLDYPSQSLVLWLSPLKLHLHHSSDTAGSVCWELCAKDCSMLYADSLTASSLQSLEVLIINILQMRKQRLREVRWTCPRSELESGSPKNWTQQSDLPHVLNWFIWVITSQSSDLKVCSVTGVERKEVVRTPIKQLNMESTQRDMALTSLCNCNSP